MSFSDEIGKRMKENYETVFKTRLVRRMPVAIRIDGKAFHTFTKGFDKPFDRVLMTAMQETMKFLCENIQGCVLGYTQSDEITLILIDYENLNSSAWFNNEIQKICSISASMATLEFNRVFADLVEKDIARYSGCGGTEIMDASYRLPAMKHREAVKKGGMFDARCFNIPKEEVTNLIYWRQLDATRNSIEMAGRAYYSHGELHEKNQSDIQELLHQKGVNWNDYPTDCKRGSCCIKETYYIDSSGNEVSYNEAVFWNDEDMCNDLVEGVAMRSRWKIDHDIPIFKNEGRSYIDNLI